MKRIVVGRGSDCDIVIPDDSDNVSRHHLVISFNLFGKMKVSDTSSNGTFINGNRMLKGASIPVTTSDNIRLGDKWVLDWGQVSDPNKKTRIMLISSLSMLVVLILGACGWYVYENNRESTNNTAVMLKTGTEVEDDNWNKDSTTNVAPVATSISIEGADKNNTSSKKTARKKKSSKTVSKNKDKSEQKTTKESDLERIQVQKRDHSTEKDMPAVN